MAIVNETFANRNFPGRSALGEQFKFGKLGDKGYWYTIVGVVKEIREVGMDEESRPAVYRLHEQPTRSGSCRAGSWFARRSSRRRSSPAVRQAIWSVDKNQPICARSRPFEEIMDRQLSTPTQSTALMGAFALLALLLASLGLYGVLSYAVTQRTNEIGVRMALGATSSDILLSFGRRGLALTLAGLAIGLVLSAIAARLMTPLLYGFPRLRPGDGRRVAAFCWRWQRWPVSFPLAAPRASIPRRPSSINDDSSRPFAAAAYRMMRNAASFRSFAVALPTVISMMYSPSDSAARLRSAPTTG